MSCLEITWWNVNCPEIGMGQNQIVQVYNFIRQYLVLASISFWIYYSNILFAFSDFDECTDGHHYCNISATCANSQGKGYVLTFIAYILLKEIFITGCEIHFVAVWQDPMCAHVMLDTQAMVSCVMVRNIIGT